MTANNEDRIIHWACLLDEHGGFRTMDTTNTIASLTNVRPDIRRDMLAAGELIGRVVEISKVGDEARCRVVA